MGAWKDMLIEQDFASQQAAEDWYRYEMERDEEFARRRELILKARKLHRTGMKLQRFFPDLGEINLTMAAAFRAEARAIRQDYR